MTELGDHLRKMAPGVRPTVEAAIKTVKEIAPKAEEIASQSGPPRSKTYMWKFVRYATDDAYILGLGTFPKYATMIFYRGRELDDGGGLLQGSGKDARFIRLREPADAERPEVKRLVRRAFKLGGVTSKG